MRTRIMTSFGQLFARDDTCQDHNGQICLHCVFFNIVNRKSLSLTGHVACYSRLDFMSEKICEINSCNNLTHFTHCCLNLN